MMLAVCVKKLASASFALSGLGRRMVKRLEDLPKCPSALMVHLRGILPKDMHARLDLIRAKSDNPVRDAKDLLKDYVAQTAKK